MKNSVTRPKYEKITLFCMMHFFLKVFLLCGSHLCDYLFFISEVCLAITPLFLSFM